MKLFERAPLALAVGALLCQSAYAQTAETHSTTIQNAEYVLPTVSATYSQGAKVTNNLVTLQSKDQSVETDLRGLAKDEPALGIGGGNGTSQFFYIRNMGQNSVDVKVDNAYSDSQIHYHQGRHMLDPAMVKIVSVQKGAGSASAGIGQTNGAIIAKTLDADDLLQNSQNPNFGAKVGALYNSNDGRALNGSIFGRTGQFDYLLSFNNVKEADYTAGRGYADYLRTAQDYRQAQDGKKAGPAEPLNDNGKVPYSALDKTSLLLKGGVEFGEHRVVLSHLQERHKGLRTVRQEFTVLKSGGIPLDRQAPTDITMAVKNTNLAWTGHNLGFVTRGDANAYVLEHSRESADDSKNGYAGGARNTGKTTTKVTAKGFNVNLDSPVYTNTTLKYGINYRAQESIPNKLFAPDLRNQQKTDTGIYAEAIMDLGDITATAGARIDRFDFVAMDGKKASGTNFNPSVGLIYQATPDLSISASHNYATRSPRLFDAIIAHGGGRDVVSIGANTKAEQAQNTEIGFNYKHDNISVYGNYFWQNIKDALGDSKGRNNHPLCDPQKDCYKEIINAGKVKNQGYELGAVFNQDNITARAGVAHSTPKFEGDQLSANPEYGVVAGRTWTASLAYRLPNPNLEIGVRHRTVERAEGSILTRAGAKNAVREGYSVNDVFANYKPYGTDNFNVNVGINNITDKFYYPHAQRQEVNGYYNTNPAAGREFRVGVNYTY